MYFFITFISNFFYFKYNKLFNLLSLQSITVKLSLRINYEFSILNANENKKIKMMG